MAADANLAAELDAVANHGAAGDADLRREQYVPAKDHAVRNLHEVVDLRARLDPRLADRRPIDRRVGADLDIVLDHDRRGLRDLFVRAVRTRREAVAVAADHGAVLDDHARADGAALAD